MNVIYWRQTQLCAVFQQNEIVLKKNLKKLHFFSCNVTCDVIYGHKLNMLDINRWIFVSTTTIISFLLHKYCQKIRKISKNVTFFYSCHVIVTLLSSKVIPIYTFKLSRFWHQNKSFKRSESENIVFPNTRIDTMANTWIHTHIYTGRHRTFSDFIVFRDLENDFKKGFFALLQDFIDFLFSQNNTSLSLLS